MIRLTLHPEAEQEIHLFNKGTISIGSDQEHVDLALSGSAIKPLHLTIAKVDGRLMIINETNDPFVVINRLPFGKRQIQTGDIIFLGNYEILFEEIKDEVPIPQETYTPPLPSTSLQIEPLFSFNLPFENEVAKLSDNELKLLQIPEDSPPSTRIAPSLRKASLKDDYLKDLDDDPKAPVAGRLQQQSSHLTLAWRTIIGFLFVIFAVACLVGTMMYFTLSDRTVDQELTVAQGMSDVAAALTYAQIHHLSPNNQNWADIDFIKTNLQALLPPSTASYASMIDTQGQFDSVPYSLRIYTNSDFSHFLLIAQPAPGLFNWVVPKSIIVVDSKDMRLRTLKNVKYLNRLLANSEALEEKNRGEILSIIREGKMISLSELSLSANNPEFSPPKDFIDSQPEAANYIYNAPRYYRMGNTISQLAMTLALTKGSSHDVTVLKREVERIDIMNHYILYSEKGKNAAELIKQTIMTFAPNENLFFGYIDFSRQDKINQAFLIDKIPSNKNEGSINNQDTSMDDIALDTQQTRTQPHFQDSSPPTKTDINHPIYIKLRTVMKERTAKLRPLIDKINLLTEDELRNPDPHFYIEFQAASNEFLIVEDQYKRLIKESIESLYQQHEEMSVGEFLSYLTEFHLDHLIEHGDQSLQLTDESYLENFKTMLTHIENCKTFVELDNLVNIAITLLNLDSIKKPMELIDYQNMLRNQTLQQLEKFILSPQALSIFKPEDKEVLERILNHERLITDEEKEYFLDELEQLL